MKVKGILAAVAATSMMVGCATQVFNPAEVKYDPNASFAKNLGDHFGYLRIKDQKVPEGVDYYDGMMMSLVGNEVVFHAPQGLGVSHLSAIGLSALFTIGASLDTKYEAWDSVMGYIPVSKAKDHLEAARVLRDDVRKAIVATIKEVYPKGKVIFENYYIDSSKYALIDIDSEIVGIRLIQEDIGCSTIDKGKDYACEFIVTVPVTKAYTTPQRIPSFLSKKQEMAWYMTPYEGYLENRIQSIKVSFGKETQLGKENVKYKLYPLISKKLPAHLYIYASSSQNADKKTLPPMIFDHGKLHMFIKPTQQN